MSKISDIIEQFILEQMEDCEFVNLSRNELASFFGCAPSQINYVLSTRFTEPRGYIIESCRGGGGYIRLIRVNMNENDYIRNLVSSTLIGEIDYHEGMSIIDQLLRYNFISEQSANLLGFAISPKALALPVRLENKQRANILRNVLINMLREK